MPGRRDLSDAETVNLHGYFSALYKNGKMKYGAYSKAGDLFGVSSKTATRIWKRALNRPPGVSVLEALKKKYKKNCGRRPISQELLSEKLSIVPLLRRSTLRSCAVATGLAVSTLHNAFKRGVLTRYRSYAKPSLLEKNKLERMQFCFSHIRRNLPTLPFEDMHNIIHIDEKWFYFTRVKNSFYLTPEEELPYRATKSKRYITKVMFLAAVARPRYNYTTRKYWDGKLGIWPIVHKVAAQRTSRNRSAGTMETKSLNLNGEVFTQYVIEHVIPAIKEKWPGRRKSQILIQQDNAKPHRQSLQAQECAVNIDELIQAVVKSYNDIDPTSLEDNFITLQSVMREILAHDGGNDFKIPHLDKKGNRRRGTEITRLHCPANIYKSAKKYITSKE